MTERGRQPARVGVRELRQNSASRPYGEWSPLIELASAMELGGDLAAFVSYDARLAAAAVALGLPVATPGVGRS